MTQTIMPIVGTFDKDTGELLGVSPPGEPPVAIGGGGSEGEVIVGTTDTATEIRAKVQETFPPAEEDSPAGRGRKIKVPAGLIPWLSTSLSTVQSIEGAGKGSTTASYQLGIGAGAGTYAAVTLDDDSTSIHGLRGQGSIRDIAFYGNSITKGGTVPLDRVVHGYYAPARAEGVGHTMCDVDWMNFTGNGVHLEGGSDQAMFNHVRSEGNDGWGFWISGASDSKNWACGAQGNKLGALRAESCATFRWSWFDAGNPNGTLYEGTYTIELVNMARAVLHTGEVSGRVMVSGRNDQGTGVRYDMTSIMFRDVSFKIDENLPGAYAAHGKTGQYTSSLVIEDADNVMLDGCKSMFGDVTPSQAMIDATPDYFVEFTSTTGGGTAPVRRGFAKFNNMSGIVHRRGRVGEVAETLTFKKHITTHPHLIEWIGFNPGVPELVSYDAANPPRNFLLCADFGATTALTYNKADYKIGYLFATWNTGGLLDDVATTFETPISPSVPPTGKRWMMRVYP